MRDDACLACHRRRGGQAAEERVAATNQHGAARFRPLVRDHAAHDLLLTPRRCPRSGGKIRRCSAQLQPSQ